MTRLIGLPQEFEKMAAAEAQKSGKSLEEYLLKLVTNALTLPAQPLEQTFADQTSRSQRSRRWTERSHDTRHSRSLRGA
ncbi:MAG: hypothetical protein ACRYFS_10390 [Janthinobacterium lividum]